MAYATYQQLTYTLDAAYIAELCGDSGADLPGPNDVTTALLERATQDIRAFARRGQRYSDTDLDALVAAENAQLWGLCADLAAVYLCQRRATEMPPSLEMRHKMALASLRDLSNGIQIFGDVPGAAAAGVATASGNYPAGQGGIVPVSLNPANLPFFGPFVPLQNGGSIVS